jgi:hypothetical protein
LFSEKYKDVLDNDLKSNKDRNILALMTFDKDKKVYELVKS